jgi:hypothetical protein
MPSPYPSPYWPANADRDYYRAGLREEYPKASDAQIEDLAAAGAMIDAGSKRFVSVTRAAAFDGEAVTEGEADKLRALGSRRTLGVRWAA